MAVAVDIHLSAYRLGWHDREDEYLFKPKKGLKKRSSRQWAYPTVHLTAARMRRLRARSYSR